MSSSQDKHSDPPISSISESFNFHYHPTHLQSGQKIHLQELERCEHTCSGNHHQHQNILQYYDNATATNETHDDVGNNGSENHLEPSSHLAMPPATQDHRNLVTSAITLLSSQSAAVPSINCDSTGRIQEPPSGQCSCNVSADDDTSSGTEDKGPKCPNCVTVETRDNSSICPHICHHGNCTIVIHSRRTGNDESGSEVTEKPCRRQMVEDNKYSNHSEIYSDETDSGVKVTHSGTSEEDQGPPLPPRPPPRPRNVPFNGAIHHSSGVRKYVVWCLICGGSSCLLGIMFLGVYFLLRSYTSTVGYFETVPTFVPATLLILTGLCIMSLARRRNRYSYLIKLSGVCGLASALACALVTVTTTVLHMSRLQALKECEYQSKTRTCTCYTVMIESRMETVDDSVRFVFDSTSDCGVVHGALYSCLRAVFGLSVAGVLVAVFSCMLVYQLLSHERKKMYWEQLELRCRSLYTGQGTAPGVVHNGPSIIGTPRGGPCRCCEQCHSHRSAMPSGYPWDGDNRFWAPGQAGNFYSPNPGGEEIGNNNRGIIQTGQRNRGPGWSWPRMPWQRNEPQRYRQTPSSPDSQYGFSNSPNVMESVPNSTTQSGYTVIGGPPYGVWGPPPPYSDPNSPARRGRYQYIHSSQCQPMMEHVMQQSQQQSSNLTILECHQHNSVSENHSIETFCPQQQTHRNLLKRHQPAFKTKDNYENTPSDSDGPRDRFSNTLPVRKTKKRIEMGAKSIGSNQPAHRINVQNIFSAQPQAEQSVENDYNEPTSNSGKTDILVENRDANTNHPKIRRIKAGIENSGFQSHQDAVVHENRIKILEPSESEVYFADVSSCCNISVKNDNYYEDANQRRKDLKENMNKVENEDYLAQRFGKREPSVRSRLPFPQIIQENFAEQNALHMNVTVPAITPRTSLIHKDISRQSMCSIDSSEKTDFTDLSPATPGSGFTGITSVYTGPERAGNITNYSPNFRDFTEPNTSNFVASFPYSSNEQSQEAHRRSTKNLQDVFLAPDAQYEVIKDSNNKFQNVGLTLGYGEDNISSSSSSSCQKQQNHFHNSKIVKNLNITPIKRQNLGTNITAIIQNLGGSDVSLLYPENRRDYDMESQSDCSNQQIAAPQAIQSSKTKSILDNDWSDHSDHRL